MLGKVVSDPNAQHSLAKQRLSQSLLRSPVQPPNAAVVIPGTDQNLNMGGVSLPPPLNCSSQKNDGQGQTSSRAGVRTQESSEISGSSKSSVLEVSSQNCLPTLLAPSIVAVVRPPKMIAPPDIAFIDFARTVALIPGLSEPKNGMFISVIEANRLEWNNEYHRMLCYLDQFAFGLSHLKALETDIFKSLREKAVDYFDSSEYVRMPHCDKELFHAVLRTLESRQVTGGSNDMTRSIDYMKKNMKTMYDYLATSVLANDGNGPTSKNGPVPGNGPASKNGPVPGNGTVPGNGPALKNGPVPGNGPASKNGPVPGNRSAPENGPAPENGFAPGSPSSPGVDVTFLHGVPLKQAFTAGRTENNTAACENLKNWGRQVLASSERLQLCRLKQSSSRSPQRNKENAAESAESKSEVSYHDDDILIPVKKFKQGREKHPEDIKRNLRPRVKRPSPRPVPARPGLRKGLRVNPKPVVRYNAREIEVEEDESDE